MIAQIVTEAQEEGVFRSDIEARFAAMAFYGAIEQLLTGWIFGLLPQGSRAFRARQVAGRGDDLRRPRGGRRAPQRSRLSARGRPVSGRTGFRYDIPGQ